jgi:pyruvate formate lyase activating enzyme
MGKPVWIRFVLVPGLTDDPENIEKVAQFVAPMSNVEWVEVLPFHQMGAFKWKTLGLDYKLADTPTPTESQVQAALDIFQAAGCRAR